MARVFADDYDRLFKVVYEEAAQISGALPFEPGEEIRNAFDHFALASQCATEVDAAPIPPSPDIEAVRERAWTNIEQARRHIVTGRFYCLEHQLRHQIEAIADFAPRLGAALDATATSFQARADALEARIPSARTIDISPTTVKAEIARQITHMQDKVREITNLLNDYFTLYREIRQTIDASPRSH
jgi:hypothetical protein